MTTITEKETFEAEVMKAEVPVLVDFYADWCPPCQKMMPVVESLEREWAGRARVVKVNIEEAPALAERFGVQSIPTFAIIRDGQVREKFMGTRPKAELEEALRRHL